MISLSCGIQESPLHGSRKQNSVYQEREKERAYVDQRVQSCSYIG